MTRLHVAEDPRFVKELKVLGEAREVGRGFLVGKVLIWVSNQKKCERFHYIGVIAGIDGAGRDGSVGLLLSCLLLILLNALLS